MITIVRKVKLQPGDPLLAAAAKMEPKVRAAFLNAVDAVRDQVSLADLEKAIASKDSGRVIAALSMDERFAQALGGAGLAHNVGNMRDALQATFQEGAKSALASLPTTVSVATEFNLLNPESVRFLEQYTFNLIQQISADARASIQQILLRAFNEGGHPYEQARAIRGVIGLTSNMEKAVANYREALEGGNLRQTLGRALRDGRYDRSLLSSINSGKQLPQARIDSMVERYEQKMLQYRARNIARTETIRASNAGQHELWRQAIAQGRLPDTVKRKWITAGDDRTCPVCLALDGEVRGFYEEFSPGVLHPPHHPSCLPASTLCIAQDVEGVVEYPFDGELVILRTASGNCITCTPNHPVLTNRGWVAAHLLDVGTDVVSSARQVWRSSPPNNMTLASLGVKYQYMPTAIQNILRSFSCSPQVSAKKVKLSAEDFHGDGKSGEVAVVHSNCFLGDSFYSEFFQEFLQTFLYNRYIALPSFQCLSLFDKSTSINCSTTRRRICGSCLRTKFGKSQLRRHERVGFLFGSWFNSSSFKSQVDTVSSNPEEFGKPIGRPSGSVFSDKIVYRDVRSAKCHVFNLQTTSGEFEADGIITHNCRCTLALLGSSMRKAA